MVWEGGIIIYGRLGGGEGIVWRNWRIDWDLRVGSQVRSMKNGKTLSSIVRLENKLCLRQ